jgi:hypothetical protein
MSLGVLEEALTRLPIWKSRVESASALGLWI